MEHEPFSPLALKIQTWVNEECLHDDHEVRQQAFEALYLIACQCDNITNYASAQAIACALRGHFITRFRLIRGRAEYHAKKKHGDVDRTLAHLATDRLPDTLTQIPSLDSQLRALLPIFRAIRDDNGGINWGACQFFHQQLQRSIPSQLPASPVRVHTTYQTFLRERMHQAMTRRNTHESRSVTLSPNETQRTRVAQSRAAGFG